MNYLTCKWSQVRYIRKNAMTIDTSEFIISVLYQWNLDILTIVQKRLYDFVPWRYGLSWSTTNPLCFPPRNITKNAETHPSPMRDVIIEQQ